MKTLRKFGSAFLGAVVYLASDVIIQKVIGREHDLLHYLIGTLLFFIIMTVFLFIKDGKAKKSDQGQH
ncbi:MAG: hypothetical protein M0P23_05000 [Bacteroidales bacterium]|jgi:hypothetical protein|nr:hypothetical protein [Bacteroidales bacterium]